MHPSRDVPAIGERVVVRSRTGGVGPSGGPELTDVIGHVLAVDEHEVRLERRDATVTTVAWAEVVTWKRVPEAR